MKPSFKNAVFSLLTALLFLLFITRSSTAIDYMKKGLELCLHNVIPSLFPLMVVSELISSGEGGSFWRKTLSPIARLVLGVGAESSVALLLGALCGFPVGTRVLCDAYDKGRITKKELERSLCFCNNSGVGFVISAVGASLFGNISLGAIFFACSLLSAFTVGIAQRLIFGSVASDHSPSQYQCPPPRPFTERITIAVRSSALSMLTVCAFVVFFSSLVGCIGAILRSFGINREIMAAVFCLFELSSGISAAAKLSSTHAVILTAAALSWSGLSVHFQIMTVASDRKIRFAPYFISKAIQSLLSAATAAILLRFIPLSDDVFNNNTASALPSSLVSGVFVGMALVFVSIFTIFIDKIRKKPCKKSNRKFF